MREHWRQLAARAQALAVRRAGLSGRASADRQAEHTALDQAHTANARLDIAESVRSVLDKLQHREHERAVGAYEELLSAFLSDVLPGERGLVMDLHTERGAPALDLFVRKGPDMPLEDALLGTGGSVTNVLSTGLRMIALLRSGQRRFLVLDESDCWLKPDLIPRYAQVVAQMSAELGVQILMISHHDESLFAGHIPHRVRLHKPDGARLVCEWSDTSELPEWQPDDDGIRSISLTDFQSHARTHLFLSPRVTLLQGDNDVGKSAIVNALRAVFDGDSNETMIRHHAPSATVSIDFGLAGQLDWKRHRKGKVKVAYTLIDPDTGLPARSSEGTKVPDWVRQHTGIHRVDGLDIQIGQQQDPVFLLNQPASTRAKALAIGQESGHVNAMMLLDKDEVQAAKASVKAAERQLEALRHRLRALAPLADAEPPPDLPPQADDQRAMRMHDLAQRWRLAQQKADILSRITDLPVILSPALRAPATRSLLARWKGASAAAQVLSRLPQAAPIAPVLSRAIDARLCLRRYRVAMRLLNATARLISAPPATTPPQPQSRGQSALAARWRLATSRLAILTALPPPSPPPPSCMAAPPSALLKRWSFAQSTLDAQQVKLDEAEAALSSATAEIAQRYPVCPTCGRSGVPGGDGCQPASVV